MRNLKRTISKTIRGYEMTKPLIFGHRGAPYNQPENTLKSFKQAFQDGADGIEFDVRLTSDKEMIVIHDETINRTTNGTGFVKELTHMEIRQVNINNKLKIPTLEEVVKKFGNEKWLNIEIKEPGFEKQLIELLNDLQITKKIVLSSFFVSVIQEINNISKKFSTALLFTYEINDFQSLKKEMVIDSIHPHHKLVNKELMDQAKNNKLAVRAWTVDNPTKALSLTKIGIDGIITNNPKKIITKLKTLKR
ncbi:MAG: hypothetical protein GF308_12955 [Candidatus Heimdallarchaeota archaeon]|nr:hypothetical protein [Candidatus Heimdallarchaeota archaeon]